MSNSMDQVGCYVSPYPGVNCLQRFNDFIKLVKKRYNALMAKPSILSLFLNLFDKIQFR